MSTGHLSPMSTSRSVTHPAGLHPEPVIGSDRNGRSGLTETTDRVRPKYAAARRLTCSRTSMRPPYKFQASHCTRRRRSSRGSGRDDTRAPRITMEETLGSFFFTKSWTSKMRPARGDPSWPRHDARVRARLSRDSGGASSACHAAPSTRLRQRHVRELLREPRARARVPLDTNSATASSAAWPILRLRCWPRIVTGASATSRSWSRGLSSRSRDIRSVLYRRHDRSAMTARLSRVVRTRSRVTCRLTGVGSMRCHSSRRVFELVILALVRHALGWRPPS
jgi:hypothetical protein